ncbi:hypothetical protein EJ07DRAFT_157307 [Lizonia empirigonia]|nr:hypothetical protein EJ07DRAFT_157307 [Lizonia empirigonia]
MRWYNNDDSIADLRSCLDEKDAIIELRNQIIEQQSNLIEELEASNRKLTNMYCIDQETEQHKAALEEFRDVGTLRKRINGLERENQELRKTKTRYASVIKDLKDQIGRDEKQVQGLRDEIAYLETHNLGLRDELVAKEIQHRHENDEMANYYKAQLSPYKHALEVLHNLAEQGGDELIIAVSFAQALKLRGLQLHTFGIDEERVDTLFEYVQQARTLHSAHHPHPHSRELRHKSDPQHLPPSTPSHTLSPALHCPPSPLPNPQPPLPPAPPTNDTQPLHLGASNNAPDTGPQPPFPPEIMANRVDYHNFDSPG